MKIEITIQPDTRRNRLNVRASWPNVRRRETAQSKAAVNLWLHLRQLLTEHPAAPATFTVKRNRNTRTDTVHLYLPE